jgi:hypothetical protein
MMGLLKALLLAPVAVGAAVVTVTALPVLGAAGTISGAGLLVANTVGVAGALEEGYKSD